MTESKRLELIKNAVASPTEVAPRLQDLLEELKAEEFILEHGVQNASDNEVKDEFLSLDSVESDKDDEDFDADENLVDMDSVSDSMREIFGE
tara:strand:+ start:237 stop:512 length:276 start_codon:yes stop_codon:yes gene_type:complete